MTDQPTKPLMTPTKAAALEAALPAIREQIAQEGTD